MGIGPVEYLVVAFPGNKFNGEVAPALRDLIDSNTIRVLDLAFVMKDVDGNVVGAELEDAGSDVMQAFNALTIERGGLLNDDDLVDIGEALDANSSAAILVWEDLWAKRFADAVADSGLLELGQHAVSAVHVQAEEVLDPVVGVGAATRRRPHLRDPRPYRGRRRLDCDRACRDSVRMFEQLVAEEARADFLRRCAPGEDRCAQQLLVDNRTPSKCGTNCQQRVAFHLRPPWTVAA